MSTREHPEAFGVFKPIGHVVVSFPDDADLQAAAADLASAGFSAKDVVRYSPAQMKAQVQSDIASASPLASIGQEMNLVKAHGSLAEQGYSFLVVHAPEDEQAEQVARIARAHHAERAQKYGRLVIEDLIDAGTGETQTFESPARGLDAETPSGREEERARKH